MLEPSESMERAPAPQQPANVPAPEGGEPERAPAPASRENKTVDVDAFFQKVDTIQTRKAIIHDVVGENEKANEKNPQITPERVATLLRKLDDHELRVILEAQGKAPDEIDTFLEEAHKSWDDKKSGQDSDATIAVQYIRLLDKNKSLTGEQTQHFIDLIEEKIGREGAKRHKDAAKMGEADLKKAAQEFLNSPVENLQELAKTEEGKKRIKKLIEEFRAAIPTMGDYVVKNATIDSFINFVLTGEEHSYGNSVFEMEKRGQAFIDEETLGEAPFYNNPDACRELAENTLLHLDVLDEETKVKIRATRPPLDPTAIPPEFLSEEGGEEKTIDKEKYSKWLREKFAEMLQQQKDAMQKQMKKELFAKGVRKGKKLEKGQAHEAEFGTIEEFDEKFEIASEFVRKLLSLI